MTSKRMMCAAIFSMLILAGLCAQEVVALPYFG